MCVFLCVSILNDNQIFKINSADLIVPPYFHFQRHFIYVLFNILCNSISFQSLFPFVFLPFSLSNLFTNPVVP